LRILARCLLMTKRPQTPQATAPARNVTFGVCVQTPFFMEQQNA